MERTTDYLMPKVSVIIPFKNRIPWLTEAVESVLAQTFQDFEIIIVDNGSTDSYEAPNDPRIQYIRQEDRGPAGGRNRGMDEARGEYIAFLDSDDLFMPAKLERQVAFMDSRSETLLTHTSYIRMNAKGEELETIHSGKFSGGLCDELIFRCPTATPTVMIRREAGVRFDEYAKPDGDVIMWLEIAAKSPLLGIDEPLVKVRMHGSNAIFDPQTQVMGAVTTWSHIIKRKLPLSRPLRSRVHLTLYSFRSDARDLLHSFTAWPFNRSIYEPALKHLLAAIRRRLSSSNRAANGRSPVGKA
jgi:glycosyltransferase involved in cell wall biosynthesis